MILLWLLFAILYYRKCFYLIFIKRQRQDTFQNVSMKTLLVKEMQYWDIEHCHDEISFNECLRLSHSLCIRGLIGIKICTNCIKIKEEEERDNSVCQ